MVRRVAPFAAVLLCLAAGAAGPVTRDQIAAAERDHAARIAAQQEADQRLRAAQAEEQRLADERIAATARLRAAESQSAALLDRLADLDRRGQGARARLAETTGRIAPLLPLIERLSLYPAETMLTVPASPDQALRGLLVLRGMAHGVEAQAVRLRAEQTEVSRLETEISDARIAMDQSLATQRGLSASLDQQIAVTREARRAAEDLAADAARAAAADASRAETLRAALDRLDNDRRAAESQARDQAARAEQQRLDAERRRMSDEARQRRTAAADSTRQRSEALAQPAGPGLATPAGQIVAPVAGTVVRQWGDPGDAGPAIGLSYRTPPRARVSAPCTGRVVFAAPFRSYGLLLILDCGGGYHFVLAGMERLDIQVGQSLHAGEPCGQMAEWDPSRPGDAATLYLELRRDGQSINPAPFLKARG